MNRNKILLATGSDQLDSIFQTVFTDPEILRGAGSEKDMWEIAKSSIDMRKHILDKLPVERPDILIVHDKLVSEKENSVERDNEWLSIFEQIRIYYPTVRIIFIGRRRDNDPLIIPLIDLGIYDLFIEEQFDATDLIKQLSIPPSIGRVIHLKNKGAKKIVPTEISNNEHPQPEIEQHITVIKAADPEKEQFLEEEIEPDEKEQEEEHSQESIEEEITNPQVVNESQNIDIRIETSLPEEEKNKINIVNDYDGTSSPSFIKRFIKEKNSDEKQPKPAKIRNSKSILLSDRESFVVSVVSPFSAGKTFVIRHLLEKLPPNISVIDTSGELKAFNLKQEISKEYPGKLQPITIIETRGDIEVINRSNLIIFVHTPFSHHQEITVDLVKQYASTGTPVLSLINFWDERVPVNPSNFLGCHVVSTISYQNDWLMYTWQNKALNLPALDPFIHKIIEKNSLLTKEEAKHEFA